MFSSFCTFTQWLVMFLLLFISSKLTFFFLLLPYRIWLKRLKSWRLSVTFAMFLFFPISFPTTIWQISYSFLEPTFVSVPSLTIFVQELISLSLSLLGSNVFPFISLCPSQILLWGRYSTFHRAPNQQSMLSSCPERRRYCIFSKTGDIASLKNTDAKQEKSVLLFRAKSWWKRARKQHEGGYEGIFLCGIVKCCSLLLNHLNNYYYLVAGALYILCILRKTWRLDRPE